MPLDGTFKLQQLHDGMTVTDLQELYDDLLRLERLVDDDTFAATLAAVCPNVTEPKIRPCPLKYSGLEHLWYANEYAISIGAAPDVEKLDFHARKKQPSRDDTKSQPPDK
jgi:hypothetical protein